MGERESAQLAMKSFAAGVGTSFDLVDTGKTWRQAELNLAVAEFNLTRPVDAQLAPRAS